MRSGAPMRQMCRAEGKRPYFRYRPALGTRQCQPVHLECGCFAGSVLGGDAAHDRTDSGDLRRCILGP